MISTKIKLKGIGIIVIALLLLQVLMPIFVYGASDIATTKYRVMDRYITRIGAGETVSTFLQNVASIEDKELVVYKGNAIAATTDTIFTGMTLKVGQTSVYNLVVPGDINGDGKLTAIDLSVSMKNAVGTLNLEGVYLKAADLNYDSKITAVDLSRIKMLIVGLTLPDENNVDVSGQIVINVSTTAPAKSVVVSVQWPSDITGLTKQISVNNGKTYTSNIDEATVTENGTVIARLVDSTSKVVKSATLQITNIDNVAPATFEAKVEHTIANYLTLKGQTTDAYKYYFSKNNGTTWLPNQGLTTGEYTFTEVEPNTTISLRMKAADSVGNETITNTVTQRTFKNGIDILKEKLTGVDVNESNGTIIIPDGRVFKLTVTAEGTYKVDEIGSVEDAAQIENDETALNNIVEEFESTGVKTIEEIYEHIKATGIANVAAGLERIEVEKTNHYNMYRILENPNGTHFILFAEQIKKNFLTTSGQIAEDAVLEQVKSIISELNEQGNLSIVAVLNKAVEDGVLLEENVNRVTGQFETEVGNVYSIQKYPESETRQVLALGDLQGTVQEVENGKIAQKILDEIVKEIKDEVINWSIEDGITREELVDRDYSMFETTDGKYVSVYVDVETGYYGLAQAHKINGARIAYTLTPDFPTMTNKSILNVEATYPSGVTKIEILSELMENLGAQTYAEGTTNATLNFDITKNGNYIIKATTADGKVTEKQILVCNISTLLPIKVLISPETPRNTVVTGTQNGIEAGPITVSLQYSEALLLENADKYQYQINSTTGTWQTAAREQKIQGITENCIIYARYWDGAKSLKEIRIDVDNVDNIAPEDFNFTTINLSHSIIVQAKTTDTAKDSKGNPARTGVAGIQRYEYSLDGVNWQENSTFSKLTQGTSYTIYAKAIDNAGNEKLATNNGSTAQTKIVPKASDLVTFEYSTTELTNEAVAVNIKVGEMEDASNIVQYQILEIGQNESDLSSTAWETGTTLDVLNNCVIYVRIVDTIGQTNPDGGYAVGNVANIDNLAPQSFTPKVIARTQTSITINASQTGAALDNEATAGSLSSGIATYTYYLIPSAGNVQKIENVAEYSHKFEGLSSGKAYSIYVEAKDKAGNVRVSEQITTGTNAKEGEITEITTTIYGLQEQASYNNPIIPAGFKAVNTQEAAWGNDSTSPLGWNEGLMLADTHGNQFIWVPVDGTDVKYEKWTTKGITYTNTQDGENPADELEQITKYKGFYIARYEAGKSSSEILSKQGETPATGTRYELAKEKAETMYETTSVKSGLTTGTEWDTLLKWIANSKNEQYVTEDLSWGNYSGSKTNTGSSEDWKEKNIYDISGNAQELTNEFQGTQVIIRGGAFDNNNSAATRSSYSKELAQVNTAFRVVLYVLENAEFNPEGEGVLGIGNFNQGPGNITVNGLASSYNNPVVPVGFRAINSDGAKWTGVTPSGWNAGLVIEDVNGNQFVWVPVDGNMVKYEKGEVIWQKGTEGDILGDELPNSITNLGDSELGQIDEYKGFYIARYEAGNEEGELASKAGLRTVNALDYSTAKQYAEGMYNTPYVKSGLPTGTGWDTMTKWIENQYGKTYVTKNTSTGNGYYNTFGFSGDYAVGPNTAVEIRGDYKAGSNITKPTKNAYLLATGLVDSFKTKNIYDIAGNVWEYTTEYCEGPEGNTYIARGSDYYRHTGLTNNSTWGVAVREQLKTPPGEVRNESGFRVMLYLSEEGAKVGIYEDYNRTMDGKAATYKNPIIPAGFAPVNKGANWGNGSTTLPEWNNGLVIEDVNGNQFVWVPVDKNSVEYQKWTVRGVNYKLTDGDVVPEALTTWGETEKTQINKYGGFYVSRYEISKGAEDEAKSVADVNAWINITWDVAKEKAESMIKANTVTTGLITGTEWDTLLRWIANEKGEAAVVDDSTSWGNYANSTLGRNANAKNIYEIAGGAWEWTSEYIGNNKIFRGGVSSDTGNSSPAAYRDEYNGGEIDEATTFRTVLYITGDVLGIARKPVSEGAKLAGTAFPAIANEPVLADGMVPVVWSGSAWVETTADNSSWYSYNDATENGLYSSKWANAMTPDGSLFVWIPRYAYTITGGTADIQFLDGTTNLPSDGTELKGRVHTVFQNNPSNGGWDKELSGIWVSKYSAGYNSTTVLTSKPDVSPYQNSSGGTLYSYARSATFGLSSSQKSKVDTHMIKNSEWGAVAFLTKSKYGATDFSGTSTGNVYGIVGAPSQTQYVAGVMQTDIQSNRYDNGHAMFTGANKYMMYYGLISIGYTYESYFSGDTSWGYGGTYSGKAFDMGWGEWVETGPVAYWYQTRNGNVYPVRDTLYVTGRVYLDTPFYGDAMAWELGYWCTWDGDAIPRHGMWPYVIRSGFAVYQVCSNASASYGTTVVMITE